MTSADKSAPPRARYDEFADWYHEFAGETAAPGSIHVATADALGDVRGRRLLDLACGSGIVSRLLAERGATVVGVDISQKLLATAQEIESRDHLGVEYRLGNAQDTLWWDERPFDAACCTMGMTDIEDLDAAVGTVRTVLAPAGCFAFSIPHPCFPGDETGRPPSWPPAGYHSEGWWPPGGTGCRSRAGVHHRTLATVLNAPLRKGMHIERVEEPSVAGAPQVPFMLLVVCVSP